MRSHLYHSLSYSLLFVLILTAISCGGGGDSPVNPLYTRASAPTIDDCPLENIICVGPNLEFDTGQGHEAALRNAVASAQPGNTVAIHEGTYQHIDNNLNFLTVSVSGTATKPIVIEALRGHKVIFEGWGYEDIIGQVPTRAAEVIINITGNYVHIYNIEVKNSTRYGIDMNGNFGVLEDIIAHDCWWANLVIGGMGDRSANNNTIRSVESYRSHHGGGIAITRRSTSTTLAANNVIENSISYNNGYLANGNIVPEVPGDPGDTPNDGIGGGNSDGIGTGKDCHDQRGGLENLCPGTIIRNNVTWNNTDDGFDFSNSGKGLVENNISFGSGAAGGRGFKGLRYLIGDITYIGNIAMNNATTGFEPRTTEEIFVLHNLSAHHSNSGNFGINTIISAAFRPANPNLAKVNNNLAFNNYNGIVASSGVQLSSNQVSNMANPVPPQIPTPSFNANSVNLSFPPGLSPAQKADFIRNQFKSAFTPQAGSNLIDAATFISGVHCATADDDPVTPMPRVAICRHWRGAAPDIGPYEAR